MKGQPQPSLRGAPRAPDGKELGVDQEPSAAHGGQKEEGQDFVGFLEEKERGKASDWDS